MTIHPPHQLLAGAPLFSRVLGSFARHCIRLAGPAIIATLGLAANSATALPTIYTVGDSTVQTWASGYYPKTGWGQVLPKFFDSTKVNVVNKAVGGTSSKSFYDQYWSGVKSLVVSGDYVFIQFGINDSATDTARHTDPYTTFKDYLRNYVNETKARGGNPVIVATLRRNAWNTDGTVYDAYHDYPIAARQVATELNVPCVDLDAMCKTLMESLGQTYTTYYWYMNLASGEWPNYPSGQADNVHFQESGAIEMAQLVVQSIRQSSYTSMQNLVPALRPTYAITLTSSNSAAGMITRTQSLPQGLTFTAMARPNSGYSFVSWSGSYSSTKRIAQFTTGSAPMNITANFSGGSTSGYYKLQNRATGLCVDGMARTTNGSACGQYASGTSTNQQWSITASGSSVKLQNRATGLYIDGLGHTANGDPAGQWSSSSSSNQSWVQEAAGSYYKYRNAATGLYLDGMGRTTNGSDLGQWAGSTSNNQQFSRLAQ
jgi:lysophospholipase L1-like esterase